MSKFKLNDIYSDNNLTEIKVPDLQCIDINNYEIDSVLNLIRVLRKKYIKDFICFLPFIFLFLFLMYDYINTGSPIFSLNFLGFICIFLTFLIFLIYTFNQIQYLNINSYKKAQYGTVKNKYHLASSSRNNFEKNYFINVKFTYNSTYIRKIICTKETYEKLSVDDNMLVISFDNKKAYAVICENKQLK